MLKNERIVNIVEKTLNHVDDRLIDHGIRVAYLMYNVLKPRNMFTDKELQEICLLGMMHDAGAYRTEEIDKMVIFETIDVWNHSINGHLYQKHFSPLKDLSSVLLFHHANTEEVAVLTPSKQMLAQLISLTDRADVFALHGGSSEDFNSHADTYRNIKYSDEVVDMYLDAKIEIETIFDNIENDSEFNQLFYNTPVTVDTVEKYLNMTSTFVDFRSQNTIGHTASVAAIAEYLAKAIGKNETEVQAIVSAATFMGICKIGLPLSILDDLEQVFNYRDIAKYVEIATDILKNNVSDEVFAAVTERYKNPHDMSLYAAIVAIADTFVIFNKSKDKLISVLATMRVGNVAEIAIKNIDEIRDLVKETQEKYMEKYNKINTEYDKINHMIEDGNFEEAAKIAELAA
ncbi:MAG: hypothetical protein FWG65_03650 [Turicibacter sp.]|nr:hypothetical protein [Turicibacter sp.]